MNRRLRKLARLKYQTLIACTLCSCLGLAQDPAAPRNQRGPEGDGPGFQPPGFGQQPPNIFGPVMMLGLAHRPLPILRLPEVQRELQLSEKQIELLLAAEEALQPKIFEAMHPIAPQRIFELDDEQRDQAMQEARLTSCSPTPKHSCLAI